MAECRQLARGVVRRGDDVFVVERVDPDAGGRVFVPLGRPVSEDESPEAAVVEAFRDRLGVEVRDATDLGTFDRERVFDVEPAERWPYEESGFTLYDPDTGESTRLAWLHFDDFRKYGETLAPDGLLDALDGE